MNDVAGNHARSDFEMAPASIAVRLTESLVAGYESYGFKKPKDREAYSFQMHTSNFQSVRPSLGAWTLFGLGSESQNLPGFISINPPTATGAAQNYGSAFLPAAFQGTKFTVQDSSQRNRRIDQLRRGEANPFGINNAVNKRISRSQQRDQLDLINALNRDKLTRDQHNPLIEGAIENLELAFRMQDAVPSAMDLSSETAETLALYGINADPTDGFGRQCLLARHFAEAGVRFIELGHGSWDQHSNLQTALADNCAETDKPIAGLLADLKRRDLLKDTLILWGGGPRGCPRPHAIFRHRLRPRSQSQSLHDVDGRRRSESRLQLRGD